MSQTAQFLGPGSCLKPSRTVAPVQTAKRPISLLMNHFRSTAAATPERSHIARRLAA